MKNISLITLNKPGFLAAEKTALDLLLIDSNFNINIFYKGEEVPENNINACYVNYEDIDEILVPTWDESDAIIWFTATGIVVRKISNLLVSKVSDPAVLIMNLDRTQIIPLLSGHIGEANKLALRLSQINKRIVPFVTTATDTLGIPALDNYAINNGFEIINIETMARVSNALINQEPVNIISFEPIIKDLKAKGLNTNNVNYYNYYDSDENVNKAYPTAIIAPFQDDSVINKYNEKTFLIKVKPFVIGVGLNRGISIEELYNDFTAFLREYNISLSDVSRFASFEAKKDEEALNILSYKLGLNIKFYDEDEINSISYKFSESQAQKFFNIKGVAEPTAVLASNFHYLYIKKKAYKNTTFAAAF